jgi:hypothetical protein
VLLTRSPLSPVPKDWFSLDLHVLSAPPAFVLSQDQTLREDWFAGKPASFISFELELKVSPTEVGDEVRASSDSRTEVRETTRSRRKRTLLSFQRPVPLKRRRKKASDSRQRPPKAAVLIVSDRGLETLRLCRGRGLCYADPFGRPRNSSRDTRAVKRFRRAARSAASRPGASRRRGRRAPGRGLRPRCR